MWIKHSDTYYTNERGHELTIIEAVPGVYMIYLITKGADGEEHFVWQEDAETLEDAVEYLEKMVTEFNSGSD